MGKSNQKLMLIGMKETFVIRALEKKLQEARIEFSFVKPEVNAVNEQWSSSAVVAYYLDQSESIESSFLHYLNERLTEDDKQIIIVGEKVDTDVVSKQLPIGRILQVFLRPLNGEEFIKTVKKEFVELQNPSQKSILILDDDATYMGIIREWLKEKYQVSMAISALQAISLLATTHVDLILLDYEMPITSGPKVLEMIRSDTTLKYIPVIFLTGKSDKDSVMKVMALKPEGYLLKTITRGELLSGLQKFFAGRK